MVGMTISHYKIIEKITDRIDHRAKPIAVVLNWFQELKRLVPMGE